jgi:hypothetical protein
MKVSYEKLKDKFLEWLLASPVTRSIIIALSLTVVLTGAIAFFIMVGVYTFPTKQEQDIVLEIQFQILNAIFSLACIFDQPLRVRGLLYGIRLNIINDENLEAFWQQFHVKFPWFHPHVEHKEDIRKIKLLGWHSAFIAFTISTLGQVSMSVFMWGFNYKTRPFIGVAVSLPVSFLGNFYGLGFILRHKRRHSNKDAV